MIAKEDIDLTFAQYLVKHGLADIIVGENGYAEYISDNRQKYNKAKEKYWDKWESERLQYFQWNKEETIRSNLQLLKAKGFEAELRNFTNGHIQAKSRKLKKIFNYYSTTGTITGYGNTGIKGIDCFFDILEKY